MMPEDKQGLEDVLSHNDTTRTTQEIEEDIQLQEEAWIEKELSRKSQEKSEERKKPAEMDAYMNKE